MMINYTTLPKWVSSRLWQDALEQSGLLGTYFMEWDDQGYITNGKLLKTHDDEVPKDQRWSPTPMFRYNFRQNDVEEPNLAHLRVQLADAVRASTGTDVPILDWDHAHLWRYVNVDIYDILGPYGNWTPVITIYHSTMGNPDDAILNALISNPDRKQGVIFAVDWRGPSNRQNANLLDLSDPYGEMKEHPSWNRKATPSLASLFGAEVFGVQRHDADRAGLHYDLRLERKGVLKSWSIPKGMPTNKQHLAIATADHKMSWLDFEGDIPKGSYGAGNVKLDNKDTFDTISYSPKKWVFYVNGGKYKGKYTLIHWKENKWLIRRNKDQNK